MAPLITGGCGFIGSHLTEFHTSRGIAVMVLDDLSSGSRANLIHPELVRLTEGDIADVATVEALVEQASVVFHLAAIASVVVCQQEPERAARTNVMGTQVIFDAAAKAQKKTGRVIPVVYASSAAVYGDNADIPLKESATPTPINAYGEQKLANEQIAKQAYDHHRVRSVGLRFFNVYGPRQDPSSPYSGVISKFVEGAKAGRPLTIFGDGKQTRDFVYVGDVVRILASAAGIASGIGADTETGADIFNVCTGEATDLNLLARTISVLMRTHELAISHEAPRIGDIRHSLGDATEIMQSTRLERWTPLMQGLKETLGSHA